MSLFCDECGRLKQPRRVGGETVTVCPSCHEGPVAQEPRSLAKQRRGSPGGSASNPTLEQASRAPVGKGDGLPSSRDRSRSSSSGSSGDGSTGPGGRGAGGGRERGPPATPDRLEVPEDVELFPHATVRSGQDELLEDVRRTFREGRHLVAYAPTGLGKTVATLVPALEHAFRSGKRVFFLTSKQSQHQIAVETLHAIRERSGVPFVVADVIGKQDMCPRREARELYSKRFAEFCRREQVNHQCTYWENSNAQAVRFLQQGIHPVEESASISANRFHVCPHQTALDLAQRAHVVVCDYNYFFSDMREGMQDRLNVDLEDAILIVDEAHNLPDRIRDHLTLELNAYVLEDCREELGDLEGKGVPTAQLARALESLKELLQDLSERPGPDPDHAWEDDERLVPRDEWLEAVDHHLATRAGQLDKLDGDALLTELKEAERAFREEFGEGSRGITLVREFLSNWRIERQGLVRILERGVAPTLTYRLLDPRIISRGVFRDVHASVLMSGTLYPMRMYQDVLGLQPHRAKLQFYPSPFPQAHRLVLVDDEVTTRYKERDEAMIRRIAERVASVAEATPGNVAAFFPSYRFLDRVRAKLPHLLAGKEMVVEEREQDKGEKRDLVRDLRASGDALLLGVQGGSLSEGVDYEGNLLKGVVVVGLPFARPTLAVEALIDYYERKFGRRGRDYAYVHPAMNRVLQAAGRCIRSGSDRGVIVLADKRFAWSSYRRCFPDDLKLQSTRDPAAAARRFWS